MIDDAKNWLLWDAKGRLWWKPDGKGYTRYLSEAGRFTESEAIRHQMSSDLSSERHDIALPVSALLSTPPSDAVTVPARMWVTECAFKRNGFPSLGAFGSTSQPVVIMNVRTWERLCREIPELAARPFEVGSQE